MGKRSNGEMNYNERRESGMNTNVNINRQRETFIGAVQSMIDRGDADGLDAGFLIDYSWSNACDCEPWRISEVAIETAAMYCDDRSSCPPEMFVATQEQTQ